MGTQTPKESGSRPLSSKQSSGQTEHARMTTAKKVEGSGKPSGMPKCN
jgi:hypothetical protein